MTNQSPLPRFSLHTLTRSPSDDAQRTAVDAFIREHIDEEGSEQTPWIVVPGSLIRQGFNGMTVYATDDCGQIVAAVNAVGWYKQGRAVLRNSHPEVPELSTALTDRTAYIDAVVTHPGARRQGLASQLLTLLCAWAERLPQLGLAVVDFDQRKPGLTEFYQRNGFTVLGSKTLSIQFAGLEAGFTDDQNHPDYRVAVRIFNPNVARVPIRTNAFGITEYVGFEPLPTPSPHLNTDTRTKEPA